MVSAILKANSKNERALAKIDPSERVLLLSHCMRHSESCQAKMTKKGLLCRDDCQERCSIGRLRTAAEEMGYKAVCIAPGGSMAINFIKENRPKGIVAVACIKELEEGVCAVKHLMGEEKDKKDKDLVPVIVVIPLLKDGCVDTEVDEEEALRIIRL